jgi:hypothetical protein
MTPGKIHPAQRYNVSMLGVYEYLGALEGYDVLWRPEAARILLKCSNRAGDNWRIQMPTQKLVMGYSVTSRTEPTAEQIDLAVAMATCFAQAGREGLVRPETNKETRDAAV